MFVTGNGKVDSWQNEITPEAQSYIEHVAAEEMRYLGYA